MRRFKGTRGTIVLLVLIMMLMGYYFYLSNRIGGTKEDTTVEATKVQSVLLNDFNRNYPPTPKEVVKSYSEITEVLYNEQYSDEEFKRLADHIMELYDAELAAHQNMQDYYTNLRNEIGSYKEDGVVISSYKTSNSMDVQYFKKDGYECASLYCRYTLRRETQLQATEEIFILRKDEKGHWKIFGWDITS